jgi:acyl carrier protein
MEVKDKVFSRVAENMGVEKESLKPEMSFQELGADSLDMVEFAIDVEEEFGIVMEQEDMSKIKTLGDAVQFIESKLQ